MKICLLLHTVFLISSLKVLCGSRFQRLRSLQEFPKKFDSISAVLVKDDSLEQHQLLKDIRSLVDTSSISNFDNSISLEDIQIPEIKHLLPQELKEEKYMLDDMQRLVSLMLSLSNQKNVSCRLTLMNGTRCPKWHEDHVALRLSKSYYGSGTQFVSPSNVIVRLENFFRDKMDFDLKVSDPSSIIHLSPGDVLVMSGRKRSIVDGENIVPVLHRSPPSQECVRRFLFTVTISP